MSQIDSTELRKRLTECKDLSVREFRAVDKILTDMENVKAREDVAKQSVTLKEFAEKLNGIEYGYPQFPKEYIEYAKEHHLVIVSGASDDLCELDGAIYDEFDCFGGGDISFPYADGVISFRANWCDTVKCHMDDHIGLEQVPWSYTAPGFASKTSASEVPIFYETFWMLEDEEPYCQGMVFRLPEREV